MEDGGLDLLSDFAALVAESRDQQRQKGAVAVAENPLPFNYDDAENKLGFLAEWVLDVDEKAVLFAFVKFCARKAAVPMPRKRRSARTTWTNRTILFWSLPSRNTAALPFTRIPRKMRSSSFKRTNRIFRSVPYSSQEDSRLEFMTTCTNLKRKRHVISSWGDDVILAKQ